MSEFTVGGRRYTATKLSAFDQFHVARKFGPILLWLGNAEKEKDPKKSRSAEDEARDFAQSICAMSAPLSREDAEMGVNLCLSVVKRDVGGDKGWAPLRVDGQWMYNDIELPELLQIVWHVLSLNRLPDFFAVSPSIAGGKGQGQDTTPPTSQAGKIG